MNHFAFFNEIIMYINDTISMKNESAFNYFGMCFMPHLKL